MFVDTSPHGLDVEQGVARPGRGRDRRATGSATQEAVKGQKRLGAAEKTIAADSTDFAVHVDASVAAQGAGRRDRERGQLLRWGRPDGLRGHLRADSGCSRSPARSPRRSTSTTMNSSSPPAPRCTPGRSRRRSSSTRPADVYASYWRTRLAEGEGERLRAGRATCSRTSPTTSSRTALGGGQGERGPVHGQAREGLRERATTREVWHLWGQVTGHVVQQVGDDRLHGGARRQDHEERRRSSRRSRPRQARMGGEGGDDAAETGTLAPDAALETVPPGTDAQAGRGSRALGHGRDRRRRVREDREGVRLRDRRRAAARPGSIQKLEAGRSGSTRT